MERSNWTVCAIHALGYHGRACIIKCTCDELPCPVVTWLVSELRSTDDGKGVPGTVLAGDLRAFLKEMSCPYTELISETLTSANLKLIVEYLVSELQAAHMIMYKENHPEDSECSDSVKERREVTQDEAAIVRKIGEFVTQDKSVDSETEEVKREFCLLLDALTLDPSSSFSDVQNQVKSSLTQLPGGDIPKPLLNTELNSDQWKQLEKMNEALAKDYRCRRQMMIKRFEVTLQSFTWGERGKERAKAASSIPPLLLSSGESHVSLSLMLAAREDQSRILPVRAGPSTAVHKVLMGSVPDRGGRPGEIEPPMPDWKRERAHGDNSQRRYRPRKKSRK